jgi:hypothetical protein
MNRIIPALLLAFTLAAEADIVITNLNTVTVTAPQVVTTVTTNTLPVKNVKVVWTSFSIHYAAPAYTQAVYTVAYVLQDLRTRQEIPRSRGFLRMTESEAAAFAAARGVDFPQLAGNIGDLLNERLKLLFAQP